MMLVLFNGLWQGALLAGSAFAVARLLTKRDAATRYALWMTTLVAIAVIPPAATLLPKAFAIHDLVARAGGGHVTIRLVALSAQAAQERLRPPIVSCLLVLWALGVALKLSRLIVGVVRMEYIARTAQPLDAANPHEVFVSTEIDVPLVAGIVAPRILIPEELSRSLDAADLHRIIAHERAHVRRNDPPLNVLAHVIEAFLFFNPSVYFVARHIAAEREAACDDLAVAESGRNLDYAACLAALAQTRPRRIEVLAPTALGFRTSLLSRIARLQSAQPRITKINRKAFGGLLVIFAIIALALQVLTPALALTDSSGDAQPPAPSVIAAACVKPNAEAGVVTPEPPAFPRGLDRAASAEAVVSIAASGRVETVRIFHSSGDSAIDAAVLSAARRSTYRPKSVNCVPVPGSYLFRADFKP